MTKATFRVKGMDIFMIADSSYFHIKQEWEFMKNKRLFFLSAVVILAFSLSGFSREIVAQTPPSAVKPSGLSLDEILKRLESRYSAPGFSARFFQTSTLKAMDITETASGTMVVKRPGMMHWVYEKPDKQVIVTDGKKLWIYRPADNQVTVGSAPSFFGDGKGASFLSNIQSVRKTFQCDAGEDECQPGIRFKAGSHG